MQWLNKDLDLVGFRGKFVSGKPFKHLVIRDFLNEEMAEELLEELKSEKFTFKDSDLFQLYQTQDLKYTKNKFIGRFADFAKSKEFAKLMSEITGLRLIPGALDLAGSLYKSGSYLLCHDDQVEDRKLAWILYLSKDFTEEDGAGFTLFDNKKGKPGKEVQKYRPEWNSLMIFEVSKISFHSVEENFSDKDRYAIGGWLH